MDMPSEVLEIIFKYISVEDIINCSKTCITWKNLIEFIFKDKGNLLLINLFYYFEYV